MPQKEVYLQLICVLFFSFFFQDHLHCEGEFTPGEVHGDKGVRPPRPFNRHSWRVPGIAEARKGQTGLSHAEGHLCSVSSGSRHYCFFPLVDRPCPHPPPCAHHRCTHCPQNLITPESHNLLELYPPCTPSFPLHPHSPSCAHLPFFHPMPLPVPHILLCTSLPPLEPQPLPLHPICPSLWKPRASNHPRANGVHFCLQPGAFPSTLAACPLGGSTLHTKCQTAALSFPRIPALTLSRKVISRLAHSRFPCGSH